MNEQKKIVTQKNGPKKPAIINNTIWSLRKMINYWYCWWYFIALRSGTKLGSVSFLWFCEYWWILFTENVSWATHSNRYRICELKCVMCNQTAQCRHLFSTTFCSTLWKIPMFRNDMWILDAPITNNMIPVGSSNSRSANVRKQIPPTVDCSM